jgi:hypothetical protein
MNSIPNPKTIAEAVTQTLSTSATIYDANGYMQTAGVTVMLRTEPSYSADESVYIIGGTAHVASDIEHDEEANKLRSLAAGWTVKL